MTIKLRDRGHLHLVLLAGLRDGPVSGSELARELARRSGGRLEMSSRTVYHELHHLVRNGLAASHGAGRYSLTGSGARSLRHRESRWDDYVAAIEGVRTPEGPADRDGHRARPNTARGGVRDGPPARRAARSPR